jgi:E3 ubiquitin-protein ligase UBR4
MKTVNLNIKSRFAINNVFLSTQKNAPPITSVLVKADDPFWKDFVIKASLRYILRTMAGLAVDHSPTQLLISDKCIPILHQMEQVSSDEHVGSLAEAVLEAMAGCPQAEDKVKETRQQTKAEKKKLAMAMRAKQLKAIGLKANERGQVKADQSLLQQFVGLAEESGHSCNICREGYKFQPNKVYLSRILVACDVSPSRSNLF